MVSVIISARRRCHSSLSNWQIDNTEPTVCLQVGLREASIIITQDPFSRSSFSYFDVCSMAHRHGKVSRRTECLALEMFQMPMDLLMVRRGQSTTVPIVDIDGESARENIVRRFPCCCCAYVHIYTSLEWHIRFLFPRKETR